MTRYVHTLATCALCSAVVGTPSSATETPHRTELGMAVFWNRAAQEGVLLTTGGEAMFMRGLMMVTVPGAFALVTVGPALGQQVNPCAAKNPTGHKGQQQPDAAKTQAEQTRQNPCAAKKPVSKNPGAEKAPAASPGWPAVFRGQVERDGERP
jgi:hypothetical protein